MRTVAYVAAMLRLARALRYPTLAHQQTLWAVEGLLNAIQAELCMVFDVEDGSEFDAFLWEADPKNQKNLVILACAAETKHIGISYPKADLLTWRAMDRKKPFYDGNRRLDPEGPWADYKSVAAIPIFAAGQSTKRKGKVIAGLSVKSETPYRFDGRIREIYSTLRPALAMLTLALECRPARRA
jgi:hypothetical protein